VGEEGDDDSSPRHCDGGLSPQQSVKRRKRREEKRSGSVDGRTSMRRTNV